MKRGLQDTIYQLGPILIFNVVLLSLFTPLIDTLMSFNSKMVAYSVCANKMMDYAFIGKVFNFTECYLNLSNSNNTVNCYTNGTHVICPYNGKIYTYQLFIKEE